MTTRPSTSAPTRPSSSSARARRGGPDFEAALRDPSSTLFLSGGPSIAAHSPGEPSRKASMRAKAAASRGVDVENGEMDRSFDEDMARLAITPRKNSGQASIVAGGARLDTLSPSASRMSDASGSTTPTRSSRHRPMKSIGIDGALRYQLTVGRMGRWAERHSRDCTGQLAQIYNIQEALSVSLARYSFISRPRHAGQEGQRQGTGQPCRYASRQYGAQREHQLEWRSCDYQRAAG